MRTIYEILRSKREGQELPKDEIAHLVAGIVSGEVPEYQAAAFLMAAVILGLSTAETAALTEAMRDSGIAGTCRTSPRSSTSIRPAASETR